MNNNDQSHKSIILPLIPQLNNIELKSMKHNLKVLNNGLAICKISVLNPLTGLSVECYALIDSGAQVSVLCETVINDLKIDKSIGGETVSLSTMHADEEDLISLLVNVKIPNTHWSSSLRTFVIKDISKREEYRAIIGVDILSEFQFVYNGLYKIATLDEL